MRSLGAGLLGGEVRDIHWPATAYFQSDYRYFPAPPHETQSDVVELSSGTNLLSPPTPVLEALSSVGARPAELNAYSSPLGDPELRRAVADCEAALGGWRPGAASSYVTAGAADALRLTFGYLESIGRRRVLVLGPQYGIVHQTVTLAGLSFLELLSGDPGRFLPDPTEVAHRIHEARADVLFLTSPNNPSGEMYTPDEWQEIVRLARTHHLEIVLDKIGSDGRVDPRVKVLPYGAALNDLAWERHTFVIDSLSKRRALSGLRIGYLITTAPVEDYITCARFGSCPTLVGTRGVVNELHLTAEIDRSFERGDALTSAAALYLQELRAMYDTIHTNKALLEATLRDSIVERTSLDSGFNYLIRIGHVDGLPSTGNGFAEQLFDQCGVALYPLSCFIADGAAFAPLAQELWFRMSAALPEMEFRAGVERLHEFVGDEGTPDQKAEGPCCG